MDATTNKKIKRTYRSRVSVTLVVIITLAFIIPILPALYDGKFGLILALLVVMVLTLSLLFSIKYEIDGTTLKIYTLWFHQDLDITTITQITSSRNPISSPAASLKRLAIHYGKGKVQYISPRNQDDFVNQIKAIANL